jgi:hypothetical protein
MGHLNGKEIKKIISANKSYAELLREFKKQGT